MKPFAAHLQGPVNMAVDELDVIGNKAIFEAHGWQTQKNGKPYKNTWVFFFFCFVFLVRWVWMGLD